jgi:hypothetical protein
VRVLASCVVALACGVPIPALAQAKGDSLVIVTQQGRTVLRAADIESLPRRSMRGTLHDATEHEFAGFSLAGVLTRGGATLGDAAARLPITSWSRRRTVTAWCSAPGS